MKDGKQFSFFELISKTAILIPQIQRDYIQYRTGKVETNRKRFLDTLVRSLTQNTSVNLNFIYGNSAEVYTDSGAKNAFMPIDGQQRLTTLFLLHFYVLSEASRDAKKVLENSFFYKTRATTQDFINALLECKETFHKSEKLPSKIIRESGWYSSLWNFDPSVLSCLKVLDGIKTAFSAVGKVDFESYATLLMGENCPITFMLLEIENIDKPNELYIKMNSRGKQLTAFENFKSDLFGYINEHPAGLPCDFKSNMDNEWLQFVWNIVGKRHCEKYTDILLRELIHWIAVNRLCCIGNPANAQVTKEMIETKNPEKFYLSQYKEDENSLTEIINDIYCTMNLFCEIGENHPAVDAIFAIDNKKDFSTGIGTYMRRALLFAVTQFAKSPDALKENFDKWWRIAKNLITNSQIDSVKTYRAAISTICNSDIANLVRMLESANENAAEVNYLPLPSLGEAQIREEIIKQKLMANDGWKEAILSAESLAYFNGEILFALRLANVRDAQSASLKNLETFKENLELIKTVFEDERDDILLHRVLLVFGDYSEKISNYGDENHLRSYYFNDTEHHKQDFRGMLRKDGNLVIFKEMLEKFKESGGSFRAFAKRMCNNVQKEDIPTAAEFKELHCYLIKDESFFEYIKSYYRCWCNCGRICLLRTSTRGSYIDYRLFALSKECGVKFYEGKGTDEDYILVGNQKYTCKNDGFYAGDALVATTAYEMKKIISNA